MTLQQADPDSQEEAAQMGYTKRPGGLTALAKSAVPLLAGIVVFILLSPFHTQDTIPERCFSLVGYGVTCGNYPSLAAATITVVVVGLATWLRRRGSEAHRDA